MLKQERALRFILTFQNENTIWTVPSAVRHPQGRPCTYAIRSYATVDNLKLLNFALLGVRVRSNRLVEMVRGRFGGGQSVFNIVYVLFVHVLLLCSKFFGKNIHGIISARFLLK
ncbi:hypothetical protein EVAR_97054_1 [Eumeta japonica]|uniref:Uncharacterized protein n=1 Tax=Eumeta variegata TaxID=151549 RepID=A0A4C1WK06_EUMVA|nr:hypothetical protein EVAR_97054_1 [Eumeta japonica]